MTVTPEMPESGPVTSEMRAEFRKRAKSSGYLAAEIDEFYLAMRALEPTPQPSEGSVTPEMREAVAAALYKHEWGDKASAKDKMTISEREYWLAAADVAMAALDPEVVESREGGS